MSETMSEIMAVDTDRCDIDLTIYEYTINIFGSMLKELDKVQIIQDYCAEGLASPDMFIQEAESVIDYASGKHTADSAFLKIIKFIPKLFIGMGRACVSMITGKNSDSDPERSYPRAVSTLSNASPQQLEQFGAEVKQMTDGSITFDTRKSEFWLGEKYRHIRNWVRIIKGFAAFGKEIKNFVENDSHEYKTLADEFSKIINKEKNIDEGTISITLDAFHQIMKDGQSVAGGVSGLADELSSKLAKKMDKDFANGKDPEKWADAKRLLDNIYDVNIKVHDFARIYNWGTKIINFLGNDRKIFGHGISAKDGSGRTGEEKMIDWVGKKLGVGNAEAKQNLADAEAENKATRHEAHARVEELTNQQKANKINAEANEKRTESVENKIRTPEDRKPGIFEKAGNAVKKFVNKNIT